MLQKQFFLVLTLIENELKSTPKFHNLTFKQHFGATERCGVQNACDWSKARVFAFLEFMSLI